jgi:hypothetical protein
MIFPPEKMTFPQEKMVFPQEKMIFPQEKMVFPPEKMVFPQEKMVFPQEKMTFPQEKMVFPPVREGLQRPRKPGSAPDINPAFSPARAGHVRLSLPKRRKRRPDRAPTGKNGPVPFPAS